jgi:cytidine deaminase
MMSGSDPLYAAALSARERAMALYSGFKVGAALQCKDGTVVAGCNIESSSYGLTICAERNAIFKAISEGKREFTRMLIVADTSQPTPPCGACRQILWDFAPGIEIIIANLEGKQMVFSMPDLLPHPFGSHLL